MCSNQPGPFGPHLISLRNFEATKDFLLFLQTVLSRFHNRGRTFYIIPTTKS